MSRLVLAGVLCAVLTLIGCGDTGTGGSAGPAHPGIAKPQDALERPVGTAIGYQAPDFKTPRLDGAGDIVLSEMQGKVVLITFWASWCAPCRHEIPALEAAWKDLQTKDAVIIGVSTDDERAGADGFLKMFPVTYPVGFDAMGRKVADAWGVRSLPASFLIDNTKPVIETLSAVREGAGTTATLKASWKAADALSHVRRAEYSLNGKDWVRIEPRNGLSDARLLEYALILRPAPDTGSVLAVRVRDEFDNESVASVIVSQ